MLTNDTVDAFLELNKDALSDEQSNEYRVFTQLVRFKYSHADEYLTILDALVSGVFGTLSDFADLFIERIDGEDKYIFSDSRLVEIYNSIKDNSYTDLKNAELSFLTDEKNTYKENGTSINGLKFVLQTAISQYLKSELVEVGVVLSGDNIISPSFKIKNLQYDAQLYDVLSKYQEFLNTSEVLGSMIDDLNIKSNTLHNFESDIKNVLKKYPMFLKIASVIDLDNQNINLKPAIVDFVKFLFLNINPKTEKYTVNSAIVMDRVNLLINSYISENQAVNDEQDEAQKRLYLSLYPYYRNGDSIREASENGNGLANEVYDKLIAHDFFDKFLYINSGYLDDSEYDNLKEDIINISKITITINQISLDFAESGFLDINEEQSNGD